MLLTIDAGNTNICFAIYDGVQQVGHARVETDKFEEIPTSVGMTAEKNGITITDIIVCSVVPPVNERLITACQKEFDITPIFVTHENIDIPIHIDRPEQLGTDRMVGASAAVAYYQSPCIVVDFGTSTNFDVIDASGAHIGGVLSTGARLSLVALSDGAAQLPEIKIEEPKNVIAKNTVDAMQSGIYWGYISMVEGIIAKISEEMPHKTGKKPFVIGTGGLAPLFERGTDVFDIIDQDLIMKGLVHMHKVLK